MACDHPRTVFTLVPSAVLERYHRWQTVGGPAPSLLVFRRTAAGRVTAEGFPDEADVCEAMLNGLDPRVVRLERERLYITAANGVAVYVPVGPSPLPYCTRYGRLYRRLVDG